MSSQAVVEQIFTPLPQNRQPGTWVSFKRDPGLTNSQLAALRAESQKLGRALTDDERELVLFGKVSKKTESGIPLL